MIDIITLTTTNYRGLMDRVARLPVVLVDVHAFDLLHLGVYGHLAHFLGLVDRLLLHSLLLLPHSKVMRLRRQVLDVVIVELLVDGSAHRDLVVEIVFDINAAFNASPVRVLVLLDVVGADVHVVVDCKEILSDAGVRPLELFN
jgi:hypothetical protein